MTTNDNGRDKFAGLPIAIGDTVHVRRAVILPIKRPDELTFADGYSELLERGTSFTVTADILEANRGTTGRYGPFEHVGEEDALLGHGRWPEGISPLEPGDPRWQVARDEEVREAKALPDRKAQREALALIDRKFGPPQPTSRTTQFTKAEGGR